MKRWMTAAVAVGLVVLPLTGCSLGRDTRLVQPPVITLPPRPLIERLPLTVGVYYSPEFRSYEHTEPSAGRWKVPVGSPTVAIFDQALTAMFERVVPLASPPGGASDVPEVDAVIEPRIESVFVSWRTPAHVSIRYELTLRSRQGQPIAAWATTGEGESMLRSIDLLQHDLAWVARAMEYALYDAAAGLMVSFARQPDVRGWLESRGLLSKPVEGHER